MSDSNLLALPLEMLTIGILSDTHGYFSPKIAEHFATCDALFHAGDIGSLSVAEQLEAIAPLYAVHGNIDDLPIRERYPRTQVVQLEEITICMTHIGGYPGRYEPIARQLIAQHAPQLFISGHSHILKVMPDPTRPMLHINSGAAGLSGWHTVQTLVRLQIDGRRLCNLEVIELAR